MIISYNKLWKKLIDKKLTQADLRKGTGMAPNTLTKLRRDEDVSVGVLRSICEYLECNIGDVCEFVEEYISYKTTSGAEKLTSVSKLTDEIRGGAFSGCEDMASIALPETVKDVGAWAFEWCSSLTEIKIPKAVGHIGEGAFHRCTALREIKIPEGVTLVERDTFHRCSSLMSVSLPDSVTRIDENAFSVCESLGGIELPPSLKLIGEGAFAGCSAMERISIPEAVTEIGDRAFDWCGSLREFFLPAAVEKLGERVFEDCEELESVTVSPENSAYMDDAGILFSRDRSAILRYPQARVGAEYRIPETVKLIAGGAFSGCSRIVSIEIPAQTQEIGDGAFWGCRKLQRLVLPDSVKKTGKDAFSGCANLTVDVTDSQTGEIKYRVWMVSDHEPLSTRETLSKAWRGGTKFDFSVQDELFDSLKQFRNRAMTAFLRLAYPVGLRDGAREKYEKFLTENAAGLLELFIDGDDFDALTLLEGLGFVTAENIDSLMAAAEKKKAVAFTAHLMEYKNENFRSKGEFEL